MSARAKRTRLTWHAISRSSTPIHLTFPFPSPSRSVFLRLVSGQLRIHFRLSSCLWPENTTMRYPTWIASLLQYTTQHAIPFRHVHDVVPLMDSTTDVSQRLICIFSSGICTRRARNTRMPYGYSSVHVREYSIVRIDHLWWSRW